MSCQWMGRFWVKISGHIRVKMATMNYVKDRRKWRVRWCAVNRKTRYRFSGSRYFYEKHQAILFYAEIEQQEKLVRSSEVRPAESVHTVQTDFLRHIKKHTSRTQQHYKMVVDNFISTLPESVMRIHQIEAGHIREYLYRLSDKKCANRTLNAHLTVIKSFCRFYSDYLNLANPASKIKMLVEDPPDHRFLTSDEYHKVLEVANRLSKPRIIFLSNTGLRASEFAALRPVDINHNATAVTIVGKGRKKRTIPLNKSVRNALPFLKIGSRRALYSQCQLLAKRADIPVFGPHALRHYFATQLLLKGVPIIKVSKLLGHNSIKTTERIYAHILPDDIADVTNVLDD